MDARTYGEMRTEMEKKYDAALVERVEAGIELLRAEYGDSFADHIDPRKLDMSEGQYCMVGQLSDGFYNLGLRALGIEDGDGAAHGFDATSAALNYSDLDEIWRDVVLTLQSMKKGEAGAGEEE